MYMLSITGLRKKISMNRSHFKKKGKSDLASKIAVRALWDKQKQHHTLEPIHKFVSGHTLFISLSMASLYKVLLDSQTLVALDLYTNMLLAHTVVHRHGELLFEY